MIISERIFELMTEKGLSQKNFALLTGISQSTISDWKRKKTNPASDKIMIICDVLEISPYELLSGTEKSNFKLPDYVMVNKESEEYVVLEQFRNMDNDKKNRFMEYVKKMAE